MAFIPLLDGRRVCLELEVHGVTVTFCLNFTDEQASSPGRMQHLADTAVTEAVSNLVPEYSNDIQLMQTRATDISSFDGPQAVGAFNPGTYGAIASAVEDNQSRCKVVHLSEKRGRSFRGMTFFGPLAVNQMSLGRPGSNVRASITVAVANYIAGLESEGLTHVVRSTQINGVVQNPAVATPVIGYTTQPTMGTQSRSKPKS